MNNALAAPSLEHRLTKSEEADSRPAECITTGKWTVERVHEKATGYKSISIFDEQGLRVANIVMQLDESEMKKARLIVDAVNAYRHAGDTRDAGERG